MILALSFRKGFSGRKARRRKLRLRLVSDLLKAKKEVSGFAALTARVARKEAAESFSARDEVVAEESRSRDRSRNPAQPVARANADSCHDLCRATDRASCRRGSSVTLGKI